MAEIRVRGAGVKRVLPIAGLVGAFLLLSWLNGTPVARLIAVGSVAAIGACVSLIVMSRREVVGNEEAVTGPRPWGGRVTISRDNIDQEASGRRGTFGAVRIRSHDGRVVALDSFSREDQEKVLRELGILRNSA
jgi:hypothetical protein